MVQKLTLANAYRLNRTHYIIVLQTGFSEDCGEYRTYGLMATQRVHEGWCAGEAIHDITTNLNMAINMANVFNSRGLSSLHFRDAVEDWLAKDDF